MDNSTNTRELCISVIRSVGYTVDSDTIPEVLSDDICLLKAYKKDEQYRARILYSDNISLHESFLHECEAIKNSGSLPWIVPVSKFGRKNDVSYSVSLIGDSKWEPLNNIIKKGLSDRDILDISYNLLDCLKNLKLVHNDLTIHSVFLNKDNWQVRIDPLTVNSFRHGVLEWDKETAGIYHQHTLPGIDITDQRQLEISLCYSAAVIIYQLMTGTLPYSEDDSGIQLKYRKCPPQPISEYRLNIDKELEKLIMHYLMACIPENSISDDISFENFSSSLESIARTRKLSEKKIKTRSNITNSAKHKHIEEEQVESPQKDDSLFFKSEGEEDIYPSEKEFKRLIDAHLKPISSNTMNALPQEGDDRFKRAGKGGFGSVFRRIVDNNQYACKVTKLDVDNLEDDTQKAKLYSAVNELCFASIISDKCGSDLDKYKATPFFYLDHPVYHTFEVQEYEGEIIADYKKRLEKCIDSYELYSSDYAFLGEEILNNKIQYFIEGLRFDMEFGLPYNRYLIWFKSHDLNYIRRHQLQAVKAVIDALYNLHSLGIGHRDIKPSNMLLVLRGYESDGTPRYKVLFDDLNTAVLLNKDDCDKTFVYNPGSLSCQYAPPEYFYNNLCSGCYNVEKADVFTLSVVLYELVQCDMQFTPTAYYALPDDCKKQRDDLSPDPNIDCYYYEYWKLDPPSKAVDTRLADLIMKGLSEDPKARPTAEEMKECIDRIIRTPEQNPLNNKIPAEETTDIPDKETPSITASGSLLRIVIGIIAGCMSGISAQMMNIPFRPTSPVSGFLLFLLPVTIAVLCLGFSMSYFKSHGRKDMIASKVIPASITGLIIPLFMMSRLIPAVIAGKVLIFIGVVILANSFSGANTDK